MEKSKIKKTIQFLSSPKTFLQEQREKYLSDIMSENFLVPINQTSDDDIFIVGFPKSGNTWMQSIISGLIYGIDTQYLSDSLAQSIVPDVHARSVYTRFGYINFFKSHHLPQLNYKNVIYLVRDGRDVMVSYFAYNKNLGINITLEEMVKEGKGIFPSKWHEHVLSWAKNPHNARIIVIKYEDLLNSPIATLKSICTFSNIDRTDEQLEKIVNGNTIEQMRKKAKRYNGMGHKNWKGEKAQKFFRKGKIGSHHEEMSTKLIEYFNVEAKEALLLMGY
ncbi:MAG: sulfotransferase domain-containing protein [Bacteroidota bacterium]